MIYDIGAKCEIDDLCAEAGANGLGDYLKRKYTARIMEIAKILNARHVEHFGGEPFDFGELMSCPVRVFEDLDNAVAAAIELGGRTTVEVEAPKGKKTKNATPSS